MHNFEKVVVAAYHDAKIEGKTELLSCLVVAYSR